MRQIVTTLIVLAGFLSFAQPSFSAGPSKQYDLLDAIQKNQLQEVLELLKGGVSPDTRSYTDGIPALIFAAREGNFAIMEALLKAGARPNISTRDRDETALMIRAVGRNSQLIKLLIDHKADLDKADRANETALYKAVRARKFKNAKMLVDAGANVNVTDLRGRSVLDIAKISRSQRMIQLIEEAAKGSGR